MDFSKMTEKDINRILRKYLAFFRKHKKTFKRLGKGRQRDVFRVGDYVIKVPLNLDCVADNEHEAYMYRLSQREKGHHPMAKCRMFAGLLLIMEYVEPTRKSYNELPSWVGFVDCGQVGLTKDGSLVAYDYGLL